LKAKLFANTKYEQIEKKWQQDSCSKRRLNVFARVIEVFFSCITKINKNKKKNVNEIDLNRVFAGVF